MVCLVHSICYTKNEDKNKQTTYWLQRICKTAIQVIDYYLN